MNMKIIKKLTLGFCIALMFSGCSMTLPHSATGNEIGSKVGTSSGLMVGPFVVQPDASIKTAAKNGGISKISTVDVKNTSYLGIVNQVETIVTGE